VGVSPCGAPMISPLPPAPTRSSCRGGRRRRAACACARHWASHAPRAHVEWPMKRPGRPGPPRRAQEIDQARASHSLDPKHTAAPPAPAGPRGRRRHASTGREKAPSAIAGDADAARRHQPAEDTTDASRRRARTGAAARPSPAQRRRPCPPARADGNNRPGARVRARSRARDHPPARPRALQLAHPASSSNEKKHRSRCARTPRSLSHMNGGRSAPVRPPADRRLRRASSADADESFPHVTSQQPAPRPEDADSAPRPRETTPGHGRPPGTTACAPSPRGRGSTVSADLRSGRLSAPHGKLARCKKFTRARSCY